MQALLDLLVAPGLDAGTTLVFIIASFFTSAVTAAFGLGGGSLLIALMSLFLPAAIVVPVHGAVQLGSNSGRAVLRRKFIQWDFAGWFILGSALGAALGGQVAVLLSDYLFKIAIGLFILYSVWAPKPEIKGRGPLSTTIAGTFTSAIGMIVGVSGPLVIAFLRHLTDRREIVGTHALLMSFQNLSKLVTFIFLGFAFHDYVWLILAMIISGFIGTNLGGLLLDRIPEQAFRLIFKLILTAVALDLLRRSLWPFLFPAA